jgi:hypothetical protein
MFYKSQHAVSNTECIVDEPVRMKILSRKISSKEENLSTRIHNMDLSLSTVFHEVKAFSGDVFLMAVILE